jgi:DNA-binding response OmpR family regulator
MASIDAKSEQGAGTNGISESLRNSVRRKISEDKNMKPLNRQRILYAEDDQDSCEMVTVICKFSDIDVVTANTVSGAWQRAQTEYFDLYLLDSLFPDGDGLELCRRLREFAPHKPILIYSGNAFEDDRKKGLAAGASAYLTKPYMEDLAVTIRQNIEQTENSSWNTRTINA